MEKITLKKIVNNKNKHSVILLLTGVFLTLYTLCGAFSYQRAVYLPLLSLDTIVPFIPETIVIYIILYPCYIFWALYSYKDEDIMNKTLYGFVLLTIISCIIFLIAPVTYPRFQFPLPLDNNFTTILFRAIRKVDKANNCLPSLHVGLCFLFAFNFYKENKRKLYISLFISVLVSLSTLTTKQHYIYDIIFGFFLSLLIYITIEKITR
jgi:membrane-associated phospholipid phosphatase